MGDFPLHAAVQFTYHEYSLLPDDGRRHELIEGEFYVTPAPSSIHQTVSRRLLYALMQQLEEKGLAVIFHAPFDVILSDTTVVQPDLIALKSARKHLIGQRGLEGTPDLVIEIYSPSSRGQDQFLKRSMYARFGVPEYWLVDPDLSCVEVLGLQSDGYQLLGRFDRVSLVNSRVFPDLAIPLTPHLCAHLT